MSVDDYDACETRVLAHEGGYTNDPRDPGGPTNFGITIADARAYWKRGATATDVRNMPVSVAKSIYRSKYWAALRCDDLPAGVDDTIFDYGVNSGIARSGKVLRRVVGQPDTDWHVTDSVLNAIRARDPREIIAAVNDERMRFLRGLSTFDHFGGGWTRRVAEVRQFSLALAGGWKPSAPWSPTGNGKGQVPQPKPTGPVVAGGGAIAASGGLLHWIGAHPQLAVIVGIGIGVAVALIVNALKSAATQQQEAPTPGLIPVPAKTGA